MACRVLFSLWWLPLFFLKMGEWGVIEFRGVECRKEGSGFAGTWSVVEVGMRLSFGFVARTSAK